MSSASASALVNDAGLDAQQKQALEKAKEQITKVLQKDAKVEQRDLHDLLQKQVPCITPRAWRGRCARLPSRLRAVPLRRRRFIGARGVRRGAPPTVACTTTPTGTRRRCTSVRRWWRRPAASCRCQRRSSRFVFARALSLHARGGRIRLPPERPPTRSPPSPHRRPSPAIQAATDHLEYHCFMGLFPAIQRAWMTIDHILFLWDYTDPRGSFYQYDGLDQARPPR
eukprot:1841571-Prymnesium_polylepis.1